MSRLTTDQLNSEIRRIGLRGQRVELDSRPAENRLVNRALMDAATAGMVRDDAEPDGVVQLGRGRDSTGRFISDTGAPFPNADAGKGAGAAQPERVTTNAAMNALIRRSAGVPDMDTFR